MRKYILAVLATAILAGCKKEETTENGLMQTKSMPIKEISIVNGMLSFNKAEFYDNFVSGDEKEVLAILRQYEENSSYLSLAEQREWAEDTVYTELISSLLNHAHMIHIENKVYRINAATGRVYTLPAEYINDVTAITALKNEDLGNDLISAHSVEEDLWEISGLPVPKGGAGSGCPTINNYSGPWRRLYNDKFELTDGGSGCIGNWTSPMHTKAKARYERYGILFELYIRGWEQRSDISGTTLTCNSIRVEVPTYTFKRNNANTTTSISSFYQNYTGNQTYKKFKPYSGGNRLCWFYMNGKVGSRKGINFPWVFTEFAPVYFNYQP